MFGNLTTKREMTMPRGDKSSYTDKQKRQAEHIEEGYEHRGVSTKEATGHQAVGCAQDGSEEIAFAIRFRLLRSCSRLVRAIASTRDLQTAR
jgi:hypothetical protein